MATVARFAAFWRAFFAVLISGSFVNAAVKSDDEAWDAAASLNSVDGYYQYLSLFPDGEYVDEAVAALMKLGAIGRSRGIVPSRPSAPSATRVQGIY
jgi:hypothetical protein